MCQGGCKGKCGCNVTSTTKGEKGDLGGIGPTGPTGPMGDTGATPIVTVRDAAGNTVTNVTDILFSDANALVTNLGSGSAEVNFIPATTSWVDVQNLPYYTTGSSSFKPQYTIEGNKITFRGFLYIPLSGAGLISNTDSYLHITGVTTDDTKMSIITNATSALGVPQGRFFTTSVGSLPNFPLSATPVARDITFSNVPIYRRYEFGSPIKVAVYRSVVIIKIGAINTTFNNVTTAGVGCLMVFSPKVDEYTNGGGTPLGNDPLALSISNTIVETLAADYITSKDNYPFTVPSSGTNDPFTVDAHDIASLGGFIINLEGLSGYIN